MCWNPWYCSTGKKNIVLFSVAQWRSRWHGAPIVHYTYCLPRSRFRSYTVISTASDEHPGVARPWPGGEKRIGGRASHHGASEAIGSLLLPYAATGVSLLVVGGRSGA